MSIVATDPVATWAGDTGTFTVVRRGDPTQALNVNYRISGTASNDVDYQTISHSVQIPSGAYSNSITINPLNNGQSDVRTVTLTLVPPPLMPPVNYEIGLPNSATVFIKPDLGTNLPPRVAIATPPNGAVFPESFNIPICATAFDLDGYVATVEFFAGTNSLGLRTNNPIGAGPANPFCLIWSNAPSGRFALTAVATDNDGASSVSERVLIAVQPQPPPPTNYPPIVRITSPPNGAIFRAPVDLPVYAYARDRDGSVVNLEFFEGTNRLGSGQPACVFAGRLPSICPSNYFVFVWSNTPVGRFVLTARATDDTDESSTSPPVTVGVLPSPPPPTNRPAIVSIVATDPIAIEGTNCWPWLGLSNSVPTWSNWVGNLSFRHWFTNCGPKNATFVVRRFGATNDDLTVGYDIGGTATNGVDYLPLSGWVTIPAGARRAEITIVPLEDGPPDLNSTVVLGLQASTNVPPDYVLGVPRRAAAIIIEQFRPRPGPFLLGDNCFHLQSSGPDGAWFRVEYSTDLVNWTTVCTNQVINGSIDFIDPDAPEDSSRFYRAVPDQNGPSE